MADEVEETKVETRTESNADAEELATLRKEKADREAKAAADKDSELEELRSYKRDQEEAKAKTVKAPVKKVEKTPDTPPPAAVPEKAKKRGLGVW